MVEDRFTDEIEFGKKLVKTYWKWMLLAIAIIVVAIIGAILVFLQHVLLCPIGGNGRWTLAEWSIGTGIMFFLWLLLWEFLIVGLPTLGVLGGGIGYFWMKVISEEHKKEIDERSEKEKERRKKYRNWRVYGGSSGGGTGIINLVFLIIVYLQGAWMTPFGALAYTYWVSTFLWSLLIIGLICGIPLLIIGIVMLIKELEDVPVDTPKKVEETPKAE